MDIDNEGAFFAAAKLLANLGHRRIALLNGDPRLNFAADREYGFRRALKLGGITVDEKMIVLEGMIEEEGHAAALMLLSRLAGERLRAFLCLSMALARGVKYAADKMGLVIGRDLALIAHDDRLHGMGAESFDPPLTATQSSIGDAGRRVVEMCVAALHDPKGETAQEVWPVDLIVRQLTMLMPV
jgi:LacI family transcriptional regulator